LERKQSLEEKYLLTIERIISENPCHQCNPCSIMNLNPSAIKKILIIKPRGIGDVVLSTILLDNLKAHFKDAKIDYLTEPFAKPAIENLADVNKVLTMGKNEFSLKVALIIRKEKYDMVIDTWSNPRTAQIVFLSGVKYRVGFGYRGRKYAYNIKAASARGSHHMAEHNLELLHAMNIPIISKKIHYQIKDEDNKKAKSFISQNFDLGKPVIGIVPAGGWESKRCEPEKWSEICNALLNKYDCSLLVVSGPGDEADAEFIKDKLGEKIVHSHKTTLNELTAIINNCIIIIANDSGPMHISAALGKPTLGLFGPTDPYTAYPYGNNEWVRLDELFCIKCDLLVCPYNHECFRNLPAERVLDRLDKLIKKNSVRVILL